MATADIPHVSEEEENYLRMNLLLNNISPRVVRVCFDKEFHPSCLEASIKENIGKLLDLKMKRVINTAQWNLLFPRSGAPYSTTFDVTLMIALLRHLTELPPPSCGYDKLPSGTDTTPSDDLARIKHYRNELAHNKDGLIKSAFFTTVWEDISGAVKRLGGSNMEEECKELRTKHLDQSTVPWNIREQINQTLDQWRKTHVNFVETRAAKQVLECVRVYSCVTITASSGVGKTATLQHVVLKMADEGFDVILVNNPHDIVKFYNPNNKTLFVIDDFCGTYSVNQSDLNIWEPVIKRIKELIQNKLTKIVVACRLQVFKDEKFESLSIFKTNVCNLLSKDLCLSQPEKQLIAEMYLETEAADIIQYSDLFDCFPLLCKLYHDNHELNILDFFQNPFSVYEAEIEQLKKNGHFGKYCALALCVMFNNSIFEEVLTENINSKARTIIENTFEACRLDKGTSRLTLMDELDSLEHTFIKKDQGVYKTVHDKLFDFLSYYFGKKMIQCLINNACSELIMNRFLLEREDNDQFITIVPSKYHQIYIQRMINDWSKGEVVHVFNNKNMDNLKFRQRFLCYLNTLDITHQRQLAETCDIVRHDTVLIVCCFIGDIPLIQWCLELCDNINMCNISNVSPLCASSYGGHTEVVKILLTKKADVNMCRNDDQSFPLLVACYNNHVDIVKLLLHNKADINKCMRNETSSLCIASQNCHVDVVNLLLRNKADVNKCTDDGRSPLFIGCQNNHVDIVQLLLDNKADCNRCMLDGTSPLYIACQEGYTEIAKLLLDKKAVINKCKNDEKSPLFVAVQNDHIDIVKLLLANKADINKRFNEISLLYIACQNNHADIAKLLLDNKAAINKFTDDERSSLFIACQEGHKNIVKLLIDNNADINKCSDDGRSPLFIGCQNNHVDIVQLLLDNKADVNKCKHDKTGPLFIACQRNYVDIVKLLLKSKVDINKCWHKEASPLYIACQEGHKDIVKLLLDNNANTNKCGRNEISPLFIACQNGYTDIVKLLLETQADINKCINNGVSPLFIACVNNHIDVVKMLLSNNADINKCTDNGSSPMSISCDKGNADIVNLLLENKADINRCTPDGTSPLIIASLKNHVDVVKLLLDKKASINQCEGYGSYPLLIACQEGNKDTVKLLLDNKADTNKRSNNGLFPLYNACEKGFTDIVELLLDNKADINKCWNNETSPLFIACQKGHTDIVQLLIKNKADINKCRNDGATNLIIACQNNHVDVVKLLLDNKADINECTVLGSPILLACYFGNIDVVKILLTNGANYNKCVRAGNSRYTPMQIAIKQGYNNIAILIQEHSDKINFICRIMKHILIGFKQIK